MRERVGQILKANAQIWLDHNDDDKRLKKKTLKEEHYAFQKLC